MPFEMEPNFKGKCLTTMSYSLLQLFIRLKVVTVIHIPFANGSGLQQSFSFTRRAYPSAVKCGKTEDIKSHFILLGNNSGVSIPKSHTSVRRGCMFHK
jgi:hypothetical protein